MKLNDLIGKRFGRLVVIAKGKSKNKKVRWLCKCDCGNYKEVGANELKRGTTKSCGCYNIEKLKLRAKHNMCDSRLYSIWRCMKYRCKGTKNPQSYLYKDRGIKLYEPWNDFNNFYEWAKDKYYICDTINGSVSGWKDIYTSGYKPYVTGTLSEQASSSDVTLGFTIFDFTPSKIICQCGNGNAFFANIIPNGFSLTIPAGTTTIHYIAFK